jgi:alpha-ketoglutarate-dependent taurine dioxygenase
MAVKGTEGKPLTMYESWCAVDLFDVTCDLLQRTPVGVRPTSGLRQLRQARAVEGDEIVGEIAFERVAPALGAEAHGIDLRRPLDGDLFSCLESALYEHQVLFLRDQFLSGDQQLALAEQFGIPRPSEPFGFFGETNPLMTMVIDPDHPPRADNWHTDTPFLSNPPLVGLHCGIRIPSVGGDGVWSNLYRVFDGLSEALKEFCSSLHGLFTIETVRPYVLSCMGDQAAERLDAAFPDQTHALVQRHPKTGKQAIFFGGGWMPKIAELTDNESESLIQLFTKQLDNLNNQVRWKWHEGDVVIWDQRSTCHRGLADHFEVDPYRTLRTIFIEGFDSEPD